MESLQFGKETAPGKSLIDMNWQERRDYFKAFGLVLEETPTQLTSFLRRNMETQLLESDESRALRLAHSSNQAVKQGQVEEEDFDTRADVLESQAHYKLANAEAQFEVAKANYRVDMANVRHWRNLAAIVRGEQVEEAAEEIEQVVRTGERAKK